MAGLDFNITHDSDWVVLAIQIASSTNTRPPERKVGIDVMELSLPHFERDVRSFVSTMELALTKDEQAWILRALERQGAVRQEAEREALRRLYDLWTHKEAYTKAIGKGLGFDFTRLELRLWNCHAIEQKERISTLAQSDLAPRHLQTASAERADRRGDNILHSDNVTVPDYRFLELLLPPGRAHTLRAQGGARHLADVKAGEGTGAPSQLVLARGPQPCSLIAQQQGHNVQIAPTVAVELAEQQGWFKRFTLDDIVQLCRTIAV